MCLLSITYDYDTQYISVIILGPACPRSAQLLRFDRLLSCSAPPSRLVTPSLTLCGTLLGAQGNHYPGKDNGNVITDQSKAKPVIVIGAPSGKHSGMSDIFYNQLCTFFDIRRHESIGEIRENFNVKEFVKSINNNNVMDAIILTGGLLYSVHKNDDNSGVASGTSAHTPYKKCRLDETVSKNGTTSTPMSAVNTIIFPEVDQIVVRAHYDHRCMTGYGGNGFNQCFAELIQPDWKDIDGNLVLPWEFYDKVRPVTLVVVNVSLQVYMIAQKDNLPKNKVGLC
ncbi:hypothetical protein F5876DRAFT_83677 [Lentinula aff. lateritia]|uniref:Uncharacterized protein n=1 Tax=Lentinula aff. lateritia TaxID=2804960 RepID=A0ACC1THL0_9AGAR|nr:hypothetical protein F5876DRAFT_83677 [Lentinula aff. lateritia]